MDQKMRFRELSRELNILPHILSKELRQLEVNQLVKRTVCDTRPVTVEYELTTYSRMLGDVVRAMHIWGNLHHETIVCGTRPVAAVAGPAS